MQDPLPERKGFKIRSYAEQICQIKKTQVQRRGFEPRKR